MRDGECRERRVGCAEKVALGANTAKQMPRKKAFHIEISVNAPMEQSTGCSSLFIPNVSQFNSSSLSSHNSTSKSQQSSQEWI